MSDDYLALSDRQARASPLARYLLLAYGLLIVYASLNPFSGWREVGTSPFDFLSAPLPRFIVAFEVGVNVVAYAPLGFLAFLALRPTLMGWGALVLAAAFSGVLSLLMECLQNYLPSRVPSNVDLAANSLGATIGAAIAQVFAAHLSRDHGAQALRYRYFQDGARIDLGLVLLALWLLTLLYPGTLLFGNGDLRSLLSGPSGELFPSEAFIRYEALVAGANTVAVGMLLTLLVERGQPVRMLFILLILAALATRTLSYGLLYSAQDLFDWVTPGAGFGLAAGTLIVLIVAGATRTAKVVLCGLALMCATAVVNFAPENPYFLAALATWQQGHFLNFNGFTRLLSGFWPFMTLMYVLAFAGGRARH